MDSGYLATYILILMVCISFTHTHIQIVSRCTTVNTSLCPTGDFLFAVASDDNSEFWLSDNENPDNLKLRAYVGKVCETSVDFMITVVQVREIHALNFLLFLHF